MCAKRDCTQGIKELPAGKGACKGLSLVGDPTKQSLILCWLSGMDGSMLGWFMLLLQPGTLGTVGRDLTGAALLESQGPHSGQGLGLASQP